MKAKNCTSELRPFEGKNLTKNLTEEEIAEAKEEEKICEKEKESKINKFQADIDGYNEFLKKMTLTAS